MEQPLIVGEKTGYIYDATLTQERRANGMYIIGMNGMGKSVTMLSMLIQDVQQNRGLCLIDPHGDLVRDTLSYIPETRRDDVTLFDTRNPDFIPAFDLFAGLQAANVIERSEQISRVVAAFLKAAPATNAHRMENLLRLITIAFLDTPGYTLAEMPLLIGNEHFRSFLAGNVKDPQARDDWARFAKMTDRQWEEYTESSMTRIRKFTTDPLIKLIIGQQGKAIDFRLAMDTGRIVLIKMPRNEEMADLLGTLLVDRLLAAALSRDKLAIKDRRLFSIYVDEFARFQTDDFPRFFTEGRKYGVPTTVAHQARWQLQGNDQAPRAAHNWLVFKCEYEDASILSRGLPPPYEQVYAEETFESDERARIAIEHNMHVETMLRWPRLRPKPPERPPIPSDPWETIKTQGHPDVEITIAAQTVQETLDELEQAWYALETVWYDTYDGEPTYEVRQKIETDLTEFLTDLGSGRSDTAWNSHFRDIRSTARWDELDRPGSAKLLREAGLRTDRARLADQLVHDVQNLGKRWQKYYDWEAPEPEVYEYVTVPEPEFEPEPPPMSARQLAEKLANLPQFHFLFRYLDESGATETAWAKTKIPQKPPANPNLDEWVAEWSRRSGAPPQQIEAEIAARQAPFRDGTRGQPSPPPKGGPGPAPQKPTPFKRPD